MSVLDPFSAPAPPPLVDTNGRPLRQAVAKLTGEISAPTLMGIRNVSTGHPAQGLTPARLGSIMRAAEEGDATAYLELAEEMEEKYPHYNGLMGVRKRAVSQLPIRVEAAGESGEEKEDAALVRSWTKRLTLQSELVHVLDAIGKGYSASEIVWELDGQWLPAAIKRRDPRFFEYDRVTQETLLLRGGPEGTGLSTPLDPYKYIVHESVAKSGTPIRGGIARIVAWYYLFANFSLKDWMTFLEVYGLPLRVGKYQNGTSEEDIRLLAQAVAQIGSDAGAVIPQSMLIEFITSNGGGSANPDMFRGMLTYVDDAVSKVVLGQTSSSDAKAGGLGSGQANLHGEVRDDIADADAIDLSATLSRDVAKPIVMFNRGRRKNYPLIIVGRPDKVDVDAFLKAADHGVRNGVPIAISTWRERTGIPEPKAGEPVLISAAANSAQEPAQGVDGTDLPKKASTGLSGPFKRPSEGNRSQEVAAAVQSPKPDAIDALVEEALGGWQGMVDPALGSFEDLIAGATSMEEVRELIAIRAGDAIAAMDVTAIAELGARAGFAGKIAGLIEKPGR